MERDAEWMVQESQSNQIVCLSRENLLQRYYRIRVLAVQAKNVLEKQ